MQANWAGSALIVEVWLSRIAGGGMTLAQVVGQASRGQSLERAVRVVTA